MATRGDKQVLKRGLSALMAEMGVSGDASESGPQGLRLLSLDRILPSPTQPRKDFESGALESLAQSIRQRGVLQPIIVRPIPGGAQFEIVAGERRWRAAAMAGLAEVPALVRDFDDVEVLQVGIVENVQRADLNPIEEAAGYRALAERFGHSHEEIAVALGKSRSHVANMIRLLNLPDEVKAMVSSGRLTAGHARALLGAGDPKAVASAVVGKGLTVRQTEELVRRSGLPKRPRRGPAEKDADTRAIEGDLSAALGMSVSIVHGAAGEGGVLSIRYRSLDDLDYLCRILALSNRSDLL